MFDIERIAQTIRTIRDDGCGTAHQVPMTLRGFDWNAGARRRDAPAVSGLIACGWLAIPDSF
jgi:hypothetical protein